MSDELIPSQEKGKSVDLQESVTAVGTQEAKKLFQQAEERLKKPARWHDIAGSLSANFSIHGKREEDSIQEGDHIRISIPGPGLKEGDGDDWVRVEIIEENFNNEVDESCGVTLIVCPNPTTDGDEVAHFFADGASSTFLLTRKDKIVTAYYKGRNERPNTRDLELTDKLRNIVVAGGAMAGMSELQWKALLKGFLAIE
jgi:hypothetical protein